MGICAPTTYTVQVSFFVSMGLCAPTMSGKCYHFQCLSTSLFTKKKKKTHLGGNEVWGFIDKVMKFQRWNIKMTTLHCFKQKCEVRRRLNSPLTFSKWHPSKHSDINPNTDISPNTLTTIQTHWHQSKHTDISPNTEMSQAHCQKSKHRHQSKRLELDTSPNTLTSIKHTGCQSNNTDISPNTLTSNTLTPA